MKKIIALILASTLALCLFSGCSLLDAIEIPETNSTNEYDDTTDNEYNDGSLDFGDLFETDTTTTTAVKQEPDDDDEVTTTTKKKNTTTKKQTTTTKKSTTTTVKSETTDGYKQGSHRNGIYTSDYLGLTCKLSSDWIFYSDAEMNELNGITMDMMDKEIANKLKNATIIYEMVATNASTGDTININLEKIPASVPSSTTVQSLLESQFDLLKDSLASMGATVDSMNYERFSTKNGNVDGINISMTIGGQKYYERVACYKCNGYLVYITVASSSFSTPSKILQNTTIK